MDEFSINESVINENNGEFYTARIIAIEKGKYKLHYNGWSSKYDEWVKKEDLIKLNDMNLALMKLEKEGRKTGNSKNYTHLDLLSEISAGTDSSLPNTFPFLLKQRLIEDWNMVTQQNAHIPLPRKPSIATIFQMYDTECKEKSQYTYQNAVDFIQSLLFSINTALDKSVLYDSEMEQFNLVKEKNHLTFADVYGAEHLLRLLFIIPSLYSVSELSERDISFVHEHLFHLLKFLMYHPEFFCSMDDYCSKEICVKRIKMI